MSPTRDGGAEVNDSKGTNESERANESRARGDAHTRYEDGTVGQVDGTLVPRYAGLTTFARLPRREDVDDYGLAIVGIPFDTGVSYRPGARFGPAGIRQASRLLRPYNPALDAEPFRHVQVVDAGDITCNPFSITEGLDQIRDGLLDLIGDGRPVISLGGDHTIALPALRAVHAVHGPVALVHFDAHLDTWDTYFGEPCTHGTPFRRASEEGLVVKGRSAHVGTRGSLYDRSDLDDDSTLGYTILRSSDIDELGASGFVERIRSRVGSTPVYVSIDIDVLDPGQAPGTGTPEAGGLTSRELLAIVRGLAGLHVVAADIVEVAPVYDQAEITAVAAANLAYELISVLTTAGRS